MTDEERAGLCVVAEVLRGPPVGPLEFNMSYRAEEYECGTVACIGGFLSFHLQGLDIGRPLVLTAEQIAIADRYVEDFSSFRADDPAPGPRVNDPLETLFYPDTPSGVPDYTFITREQAAKAIHNFLAFGDPRWSEILGA